MTRKTPFLPTALISLIVTCATLVCTLSAMAATNGQAEQKQIRAFVEQAATFARSHPKSEALQAFAAPQGEFNRDGLYIFAYDFSGNVLAHGGDPALVGMNLMGMKDPNGVEVIRELAALASRGSGWLHYTWPNPAHQGRQEPKYGYVVRIDDGWFIGAGAYGKAAAQK
jgi:signal transduction histidine kinase